VRAAVARAAVFFLASVVRVDARFRGPPCDFRADGPDVLVDLFLRADCCRVDPVFVERFVVFFRPPRPTDARLATLTSQSANTR
jgi:hypothetical protein